MDYEFSPESCLVEYYFSKPSNYLEKKLIAWPFYSYRVLAPRPKICQVNLMQKAVLGLCRAGCRQADDIVKKLQFADRELALLILAELRSEFYIDDKSEPTDKGLDVLLEEHEADISLDDFIVGYVYQNPWTQELLPRFIEKPNQRYVDHSAEELFPRLILGSKGKPRNEKVFWVLPRKEENLFPKCPNAHNILKAVKRHCRSLKKQNQGTISFNNRSEEDIFPLSSPYLQKIHLVENVPQAVFLATWIYVPSNAMSTEEWLVKDPFGLGNSWQLQQNIIRKMEEDKNLGSYVEQMLESFKNELKKETQNDFIRTHTEAQYQLEKYFSIEIREYEVFPDLINAEISYIKTRQFEKTPELLVSSFCNEMQKTLEAVFLFSWGKNKETFRRKKSNLPRDKRSQNFIFNEIAKDLGAKTPLPEKLLSPHLVNSRGGGSLRSQLLSALLIAGATAEHPLRKVIAEDRDILEKINTVAGLRNQEVHASANNNSMTKENIEKVREETYSFIEKFLRT